MPDRRIVSLHHARQIILSTCTRIDAECITLADALHRVLSEPIHTSDNIPPVPVATRDGYAVISSDIVDASLKTPAKLGILRDSRNTSIKQLHTGSTVFVCAGDSLPTNSDAVVSKKDSYREPDSPIVSILQYYEAGQGIQRAGSIAAADSVIIPSGRHLSVEYIRLIALLGIDKVNVAKKPEISAVFSTSCTDKNKLRTLEIWLHTVFEQAGAAFVGFTPVKPGRLPIVRAIQNRNAASDLDIILLDNEQPSEPALDALRTNTKVMFERINTSPSGPSMLGYYHHIPVLLCGTANMEMMMEMLVRPAVKEMMGSIDNNRRLIGAKASMSFQASLGGSAFIPAIAEFVDGSIWVRPIKQHAPWDYTTEHPDGYILIPEEKNAVTRGDLVDFLLITH